MWKRLSGVGLVLVAGMGIIGCRIDGVAFSVHDRHRHRPARVRHIHVDAGHVCSRSCHKHYWNGSRVIVLGEHRHGHNCGHRWNGTHWVELGARVRPVHIDCHHGPSCGHVYHPRSHKWIAVGKKHRHHRNCGHAYIDGRWSVRIH